ncbi:MAG TPA: putative Fe-S cluster assembly protein SufT [Gammaproteobacteria bacterium]|nr:putative Fe-S cluster assembly protein SufT [Gammaproteobacteria bacterium]
MFNPESSIEITRDCEAALIPSGTKVSIKQGTLVMVTQSLGNSYTVYVNGNLARIAGKDGDALGLVVLEEPDINEMVGTLEEKIDAQLKTCFDPEIPVNIVDLGLVYNTVVTPLGKNEHHIDITMTLTAPGCGMGPVLVSDIQEKLRKIAGVTDVKVDLVFDPPWDRSKMSEVAKLQLGLL